jgi:CubicO group peptidase (beta-lactamase class C family)
LFQAASISKPVAATALLRLVDEGKLDLDRPVNDYLTSWKLPENRFTATEKVTLRRLVSHSAGTTVHGFPGYAEGDAIPTVPQILDGAKPANTAPVRVDTTPGSRWRYSGGGITIEQLAMTDVSGEGFPALARRLVFDPIGMTNSTYEQPLPADRRPAAAAGHRPDGTMVRGRWHTYPEMAAAGLWTTPTDLLKWAMEVTAARAGASTKVLSQNIATAMLTVQKEPSGLGPLLHNTGRAFYFEHGGANEGYRCQVMYYPETGQGAAIMTNSDAGDALAREVLFALAAEYKWAQYGPREIEVVPFDSATLQTILGDYPVPQEVVGGTTPTSLQMRLEGNKLTAEVPGVVPKVEMVQIADARLIAPETGMEMTLVRGAGGRVDGIDIGPAVLRKKR